MNAITGINAISTMMAVTSPSDGLSILSNMLLSFIGGRL